MITGLDCFERFGDPNTVWDEGVYMTVWDTPEYIRKAIPAIPGRIYLNKQMILNLEAALWNVIDRDLTEEIKTWDGCFLVRPIRGYETTVSRFMNQRQFEKAMIYMSIHSWGVAVDINAAWNPLGKRGEMSNELGECFEDAGFDWGAKWKRRDPMHFQLKYLT